MTRVVLRSRETWIGFAIGLIGTALLPLAVATTIDFVNPPAPEGGARRTKAVADILGIQEALTLFWQQHGRLPTREEGLVALVPDYLNRLPIDPWGHAYLYDVEGEALRVISYGSDGKLGGKGAASDITSEEFNLYRNDTNASRHPIISDTTATGLFLASVLLIPLVGYLATDRPLWSVGVLAGAAGLFAVLALALCVVALLFGGFRTFLLPLGIGVFFALATAGVLLRVRYSDGAVMAALACIVAVFWTMSGRIVS